MNPAPKEQKNKAGILLIDTSIVGVSVGLMAPTLEGSPASERSVPTLVAEASHYEMAGSIATIATLVDRCMKSAGFHAQDIDHIVVSTGPGSFTGIKIGLGFAYGWAAGSEKPIRWLGVSALACAAAAVSDTKLVQDRTLFLPATRTHGFAARRSKNGNAEPWLVDVNDSATWKDKFRDQDPESFTIVGSWPLLEAALRENAIPFDQVPSSDIAGKALAGMAKEAQNVWPSGFSLTIPLPNYLRLSTAEEQLARRAAMQARTEETS